MVSGYCQQNFIDVDGNGIFIRVLLRQDVFFRNFLSRIAKNSNFNFQLKDLTKSVTQKSFCKVD